MNTRERNIQVFTDTRKQSRGRFLAQTERMLCGVKVYEDPPSLNVSNSQKKQPIMFENKSTVSAAAFLRRDLPSDARVGILNFADALVPGGLVEYGEVTQEESICRCSNLYEGLILRRCRQQYYEYNRSLNTSVYSDRLIYSPDVLIFKHDSTYSAVKSPFTVDVITCPSPSCQCNEDILLNRIRGIVKSASLNGVTDIVLGAWGCGAFGQDAVTVGKLFGVVLKEHNYFRTVCFAIISVVDSTDTGNDYKFQKGFRSVYGY